MKKNIVVLYGGKSPEHNVSLQTARAVMNAIHKEKFNVQPVFITKEGEWRKAGLLEGTIDAVEQLQLTDGTTTPNDIVATQQVDVVFPVLHGPNGEDGTVQGMLELMNIPYVGNGVLGSSAGMDKVVMKQLFAQAGLRQAKYVYCLKNDFMNNKEQYYAQVEAELGYPCFVKPANCGSSVGISKAKDRASLEAAFAEAFTYDRKVVIEEAVVGREVEVGILGHHELRCSVPGEIVAQKDFYDYNSKYIDGDTEMIIPAVVSEATYNEMREMAFKAFRAIDGSGLVRADFFVTEDGTPLINEVNTMPGFTPFSMFPLLWQHTGVEYPALIEELVRLALERHEEKQQIKVTF